MFRRLVSVFLGLSIVLFCVIEPSYAAGKTGDILKPCTNKGKKWRIGYCESETYLNYAGTFYNIVKGLENNGWISSTAGLKFTVNQEDTKGLWDWLSSHDLGPYVEFVKDAHYNLNDPSGGSAQQIGESIIKRLRDKKDIDLMIVMGTKAGQALANNKHNVKIVVFSASNAVRAGIVKSANDSGNEHIWAHMDPDSSRRQFEIFHDIFRFKKMGIVYDNTPVGRIYAAVDTAEKIAKERGFIIIRSFVKESAGEWDQQRYYRDLLAAHKKLAPQVDGFFLTEASQKLEWLPSLLAPFYAKRVPVFSQMGVEEVAHGALLSVARADFKGIGRFGADTIANLLHGTSPRKLPQIYEDTVNIALNLKAAQKIHYKPPFEILLVSDEIYK